MEERRLRITREKARSAVPPQADGESILPLVSAQADCVPGGGRINPQQQPHEVRLRGMPFI